KAAALFVDNRYILQAPLQTDTAHVSVLARPPQNPVAWLIENLRQGAKIGFDPWLHTTAERKAMEKRLAGAGLKLVRVPNLVDQIWPDRPGPPTGKITLRTDSQSGLSRAEKLAQIAKIIAGLGADAAIITLPASVCWLFNIRGTDIPNTPVTLGFAIVFVSGPAALYLAPEKITPEITSALSGVAHLAPQAEFEPALATLPQDCPRVLVDPATCPDAITTTLAGAGATLIEAPDPIVAPKAIKNRAEIAGLRVAHRLDGIAMARFLAWFDTTVSGGNLTEMDVARQIEADRARANSLVDLSFDTIAGSGPNGAIIHYRVTETSNRTIVPGDLMLVDSGGQYLEGTTDITRTLATGPVTKEQRTHFTLVLKGMIGLSRAKFPEGITGQQLDSLARQHLWAKGLDYGHGTGHGVGAFLDVHEGPCSISPNARSALALKAGMVLSNEPGYYSKGKYGIRIENLIHVTTASTGPGGQQILAFETLTLARIDLALIDIDLLDDGERAWLNAYHARVSNEIGPHVEPKVRTWLKKATRDI
ncbi:MAG: aminopeptidase P family protein, partial [Alphaproteobacteria bacterium]|nr:aminopeptidase P family protein [Alphaproteobacteria bacterium]